jgi:hypothetical protein
MEGIVGCGKPSTILERVVGMLELSFWFFALSRGFCGAFAWSLMGVREALVAFERQVGWIQ